jgi:protein-S-isoprenylcysteine O-methyltransferase Ste14
LWFYTLTIVKGNLRDPPEAFYTMIFYILTASACIYFSLKFSKPEVAALGFAMLLSLLAYLIYAFMRQGGA